MFMEMFESIIGFWLAMLPLAMVIALFLGGLFGTMLVLGPLFAAFFQPYRKIPRSQKGAQKVEKHA